MKRVASIILGGGQGTRLFPLTMSRCKPAMCYGGRYRLIDIPISNAIHSGCQKIFIITQFLSRSLHQHIINTYPSSPNSNFIELLSAEEKHQNKTWFQGTADAVRQNLDYFMETPSDYFLILSGDQLYHMDFSHLLQFAYETQADAILTCLPVNQTDAKRMGILQIDSFHWITSFCEKPQHETELNRLRCSDMQKEHLGIKDPELNHLGSMGIYLFKREALINLLKRDAREDFGKHLIPTQIENGKVAAYIHKGYWEDIGTIDTFHKANIALTEPNPHFNCYNEDWRIFTAHTTLPGARISHAQVHQSIICEGSLVEAEEISKSILGPRTIVHKGTTIHSSYIMGNDFYIRPAETSFFPEKFQIGKNCMIRNAIIDKNVSIGNGVKLINKNNLSNYDSDHLYIRDGIIVVPRGTTIPDDFEI